MRRSIGTSGTPRLASIRSSISRRGTDSARARPAGRRGLFCRARRGMALLGECGAASNVAEALYATSVPEATDLNCGEAGNLRRPGDRDGWILDQTPGMAGPHALASGIAALSV